ncbi:MAG TPA: hypothetical protein PLK99_09580 [Burkholderiales bacterium]|nr:hypothetical protein [Burkholderiales bacterium]
MSHILAKVFQDMNYAGKYRRIRDDIGNFSSDIVFNDTVSSIHEHPEYRRSALFLQRCAQLGEDLPGNLMTKGGASNTGGNALQFPV